MNNTQETTQNQDPGLVLIKRENLPHLPLEKTSLLTKPYQQTREDFIHSLGENYCSLVLQATESLNTFSQEPQAIIIITAFREEANLPTTLSILSEYLPDQTALVIVENLPSEKIPDNSSQIVREFAEQHPQIQIDLIRVNWDHGIGGVGLARRIGTDTCLILDEKRFPQRSTGPVLISTDADILGISPNCLLNAVSHLKESNCLALCWEGTYPEEALEKNPNLCAASNIADVASACSAKILQIPKNFGGATMAFTASAYMAVGGYDHHLTAQEDTDLGNRLTSLAHKTDHKTLFISEKTYVSPRRAIFVVSQGKPINSQWYYDQFSQNDVQQAIRESRAVQQTEQPLQTAQREIEYAVKVGWSQIELSQGKTKADKYLDLLQKEFHTLGVIFEITKIKKQMGNNPDGSPRIRTFFRIKNLSVPENFFQKRISRKA